VAKEFLISDREEEVEEKTKVGVKEEDQEEKAQVKKMKEMTSRLRNIFIQHLQPSLEIS
jgi:hypothetical protein